MVVVPASLLGQTPPASSPDGVDVADALLNSPPTDQIMIKFVDATAEAALLGGRSSGYLPEISAAAGMDVSYVRLMSDDVHVIKLAEALPAVEAAEVAAKLTAVPGVKYAEPDLIMQVDERPSRNLFDVNAVPNDPRWNDQWHYRYVAGTSEGINLVPAWDIYKGSASTVVAVIDTGILPHADLAGKTVPGYDFINDTFVANDGNGRDNNPADPGDWILANECYAGSPASNSSWHGTHVAGTIAAATNNGVGVSGVNWNAKILPVRVLGKCGGYTSDIIDGMKWAAGLAVPGVPANANPAKVLNLSLGGSGTCSTTQQSAINAIVAVGTTIVVAAGNENESAALHNPGNCNNVITVASNNRTGDRAYYSNYGSLVEVAAPGGETPGNSANGVLSTLDSGTTTPNNSNTYAYYQGTSMATPHVAGVASLIVGLKPAYTPAEVLSLLQNTARSFPAGSTCNTSICGAGIVDAYEALAQASGLTSKAVLSLYVRVVPPVANPLVNPGFESGPTGWTWFSTHGWDIIVSSLPSGAAPHGGTWAVWLGGDDDEVAYVQQSVKIPDDAPYLAYWHWIDSEDVCGFDVASVRVNSTTVDDYDLCGTSSTGGWVHHVVNLSAYSGQTVTLQIRVETDGSLNSNLLVDDVAFQATAASLLEQVENPVLGMGTAVHR